MKSNVTKTILIAWSIVSLIYIIYITWTDFKAKEEAQAYQAGAINAIDQIIKQSSGGCQTFTVHDESNQVQLVNAQCLPQQSQTQAPEQSVKK